MKAHFAHAYLLNPQHKITVNLIGLGGTGSRVLSCLADLNEGLTAFGHPGIHVYAYDGDTFSLANVGRQCSPSDVGMNKAIALITRVNQFYGYEWEAIPSNFSGTVNKNITITCVDTAAARLEISASLKPSLNSSPMNRPIYWLDFGNLQKTGQVVLGTINEVKQPDKSKYETICTLPTIIQKFPQLKKIKEKDLGPSCSQAEALGKQDMYVNRSLASLGCNILWKLFREGVILNCGLYMNLDTMIVNPIKVGS